MSVDTVAPQLNDNVLQEALGYFQDGAWDQGLEKLDALIRQHPSVPELQNLREEMALRAHIDRDEEQDQKAETLKQITRWGLRGVVLLAMVSLILWGLSTYSSRIEGQWGRVRQNLVEEVEAIDLTVKFQDAQNYLNAGRPQDALLLLENIAEQNPDFPGLDQLETEATRTIDLEAKYQAANQLRAQEDLSAALAAFQEIQTEHNGYKDVSLQIQELENELILNDLFSRAEKDFAEGDWENAIVSFESLRSTAPKYQPELVQERLIESYINAASQILDTDTLSSDALVMADQYFRKALVLRPMDAKILAAQDQALSAFKERLFLSYLEKARAALVDNADSLAALATANAYYDLALDMRPDDPEVLRERQLATAYLGAQQSFLEEDWDAVINNLEIVYEQDKDYADGTSSQTLYDAYMRRGRRSIANGEYEAAIDDFQRASEIAGESPEAILQVYWSLIEMAQVYGILGEYEKADNLYHHAVEWVGFRDIVQATNPELIVLLDEAERYAGIEWFRTAYRLYTRVLPAEDLIYSGVYHDVQEGDYLTQIASEYRTTVEAILAANEISNPGDIHAGQRILVPVLRGEE
jgi:tetratricopeptide (TPR) repeat protein